MQTESNNTNGSIDIDQIKKSKLLSYDGEKDENGKTVKSGIQDILLYNIDDEKTWEEHAKNFQEEDFIKAVWSLVEHCRRNDAFCQQCYDFISAFVVSSEKEGYAYYTDIYNFFWCLWKLDIKPGELPENIREILIDEDQYLKTCVFGHGDFWQSMDYDFVVWFLDSGYLSEHEIDDFKMHHDYTFSSYQAFENFFNDDNNKYKIKIHVQALPDVLKQKSADDQYFSKDEFIDLIKKGKIIFKNPRGLDISDLPDSEWFRENNYHFKSPNYDSEKQKKLPQAKKNYWEYVKKHLFGDPGPRLYGTVKGLLDIKNLEENDIKELLSWILIKDNQNKFAFLNIESNDSGETDIFNLPKNCFTTKVGDGLSRIDFCNLSKIENENDRKKLEFFVNDLIEYKLNKSSNKKRFIAGIVLIAVGILACVIDLLVLGLASKLAIVLFLLSLLITAVGVVCLVWKQISDCVRSCVPISNSVILELGARSRITLDQSHDLNVKNVKLDESPDDEKDDEKRLK